MAKRTVKVGITGKYGTRYGANLRKRVKKIEISKKAIFFRSSTMHPSYANTPSTTPSTSAGLRLLDERLPRSRERGPPQAPTVSERFPSCFAVFQHIPPFSVCRYCGHHVVFDGGGTIGDRIPHFSPPVPFQLSPFCCRRFVIPNISPFVDSLALRPSRGSPTNTRVLQFFHCFVRLLLCVLCELLACLPLSDLPLCIRHMHTLRPPTVHPDPDALCLFAWVAIAVDEVCPHKSVARHCQLNGTFYPSCMLGF